MVYLKNNTSYIHKKTGLIYYYRNGIFIVINPITNSVESYTEDQMENEKENLIEDKFEDLKYKDYEQ